MKGQGESGQADRDDLRSFLEEPASYAAVEHLEPCFDHAISRQACERLLADRRLNERLSGLLAQHYELPGMPAGAEQDLDPADRSIVLSDSQNIGEIVLRAGAIYWANTIAGTVLGREAAALHAALGSELCAFAVANKDLAGPRQPVEPSETLRDRIMADGWRCLAAWCRAIDPAISARFRLKLSPSAPLGEAEMPFAEIGPAVVRRVASPSLR
ncbi:YOP protein translocation protein K (YscK) [Mesorhizobium sp. J18]|uniref:SctK family type III secretion system sorting platform protein n=1 Tax=Mesorhizobium sp. J18 TaxID=935263 RepID=UPI00119ACA5C|nr:SctK family type III secretion system sorting platform protein [Mesorhizobium sp. J18]TWG99546.1 YOP protein translocation protein K (YscK) [Mesorhizobium sp. J18]